MYCVWVTKREVRIIILHPLQLSYFDKFKTWYKSLICVKLKTCKASSTSKDFDLFCINTMQFYANVGCTKYVFTFSVWSDWIIQVLKLGSLYQYNAILRKCRVHKVCLLHWIFEMIESWRFVSSFKAWFLVSMMELLHHIYFVSIQCNSTQM